MTARERLRLTFDAVVPDPGNRPPPYADEVGDLGAELEASGCFSLVGARRRRWDVTYTADEWIDVLGTYSPHIAADPATTRRLFARIEARPGGRVVKHYLGVLTVGRLLTPGRCPGAPSGPTSSCCPRRSSPPA